MPKLIDYPRTTYASAWEVAEVTDDTGGKCSTETAAKKLNRKVSGSFKAIIGSAVKFGLLTSKRDLLSTTTLFKRIKHAYDKEEELMFHREAFLTPPLFTQICRKFRTRELPVQMLDVMLIREFGVEEINAPGVAKAFVEGARMVGVLDEHNIVADIDQLSAKKAPRRELSSTTPPPNAFRANTQEQQAPLDELMPKPNVQGLDALFDFNVGTPTNDIASNNSAKAETNSKKTGQDAIASLFGFGKTEESQGDGSTQLATITVRTETQEAHTPAIASRTVPAQPSATTPNTVHGLNYHIQLNGPGIDASLVISEAEDIELAISFLEKIRRQLKAR